MALPTITPEHALKQILAKPKSRPYWLAGLATDQDRIWAHYQIALARSQAVWKLHDNGDQGLYLADVYADCVVRAVPAQIARKNGMWEAVVHGAVTRHRGETRAKRYALSYGSQAEQMAKRRELAERAAQLAVRPAKGAKPGHRGPGPAHCPVCGTYGPLTRDHWIPRSKGGSDSAANIVWMCGGCNGRKGDKWPSECDWLPQNLAVGKFRSGAA